MRNAVAGTASAPRVTRLSRTTVAADGLDIVGEVLSAAPRSRPRRLVSVLRLMLGLVGLTQVAVGVDELRGAAGPAQMQVDGASAMHFGHEIAAWDLALGVGFCRVACRPLRTAGVVPTLATFVVVLTALGLVAPPDQTSLPGIVAPCSTRTELLARRY